MFKVLCSLTNSLCASSSAATNGMVGDSKELSTTEAENQKNQKYFSELKELYILGKHYPQPISKIQFIELVI